MPALENLLTDLSWLGHWPIHISALNLNMGLHVPIANVLPSQNPDKVGDMFILQVSRLRLRKILNLFKITPELVCSEAGRQGGASTPSSVVSYVQKDRKFSVSQR